MKRKPLFEETAELITKLILSDYPEGSRLPIEPELAAICNVSRATLREAIKVLCSRNILEIRRGDGTYVSHMPGMVSDPLGIRFMKEDSLVEDMGEISLIIQPEIAALVALKATSADIDNLDRNYEAFQESFAALARGETTVSEVRKADSAFHSLIMASSKNQVICRLPNLFSDFRAITEEDDDQEIKIIENSIKWHPAIIDTIRKHDQKAAKKAMLRHMVEVDTMLTGKVRPL